MSEKIKCDRCGKYAYSDRRKGDYHHIRIDGESGYYLCRKCYDLDFFMKSILHMEWNEYEQRYTEVR